MMHFLFICISLSLACSGYAQTIVHMIEKTINSHSMDLYSGTATIACPNNMIPDLEIRNGTRTAGCKCDIGYVYLRWDMGCYLPYRQWPCSPGYYVHLAINETVPKCVVNPCSEYNLVPYNGTCHKVGMWREGPCNVGGLVTDPDTFQLKCINEVANPLRIATQLKCPDNGILNTSDSEDPSTWKCQCQKSGHVYYSLKNACYQLYRKGPCQTGYYLFAASNETEPQCVVNPCAEDGLVPYNGSCYKLGVWGPGPCNIGILVFDPSTFQLECFDKIANPSAVGRHIRCPKAMFFDHYSADPKSWKCRCWNINHLYVPSYDSCYAVNQQGPCPSGQYVYSAINETVAKCTVNPCLEDGLVPYNGSCHKLGVWGEGPCNFGGLVVDPYTFQPKCIGEAANPSWLLTQLKCPGNRILNTFHSHDVNIWKCGCADFGHVYFPSRNGCYRPYRQGPCPPGHYVYVAINETVPECIVNPCSEDGLVLYNGTCHKISVWGEGPCNIGGLVPDPTTFQLKCIEDIDNPSSVAELMECPHNLTLRNSWSDDLRYWSCECPRQSHVYFPVYDACYEVYTQGPCLPGQYVYRAINETLPECAVNPCSDDTLIPYNGTCHKLGAEGGPCGKDSYLTVQMWTHQLECTEPPKGIPFLVDVPTIDCASDAQRDQYGKCRELISDD